MELVWLRDLLAEFGCRQGSVRVMEDNAGCVALAHGQKDTAKSNHFKRTQAYVEGVVGSGVMWLDDVPGEHNPADIFTKVVEPSRQFRKLRDIVMGADPNLHVSKGVMDVMVKGVDDVENANALLSQVREWQR